MFNHTGFLSVQEPEKQLLLLHLFMSLKDMKESSWVLCTSRNCNAVAETWSFRPAVSVDLDQNSAAQVDIWQGG